LTHEEQIRAIAKEISDMVNNMSFGETEREIFADEITKNHRTLQQSTMKLFYRVIQAWAVYEENGWYDERNEATVKAAKRIIEVLKEERLDFFPHI